MVEYSPEILACGEKKATTAMCENGSKGTPSENVGWAENVENLPMFAFIGFVWLLYH